MREIVAADMDGVAGGGLLCGCLGGGFTVKKMKGKAAFDTISAAPKGGTDAYEFARKHFLLLLLVPRPAPEGQHASYLYKACESFFGVRIRSPNQSFSPCFTLSFCKLS